MKKSFLALMLAGIMISAGVQAAEKETEGIPEITMDMIADAAYEGSWVSFPGEFDLYLPGEWDVLDITEEEEQEGLIFRAMDQEEAGNSIVVMTNEVGPDYTLDMILAELLAIEGTQAGVAVFNSIPAVYYTTESAAGLAFLDAAGNMCNIQAAWTDEKYEPVVQNLFFSLSPTGILETEAQETAGSEPDTSEGKE